MSFNKCIIVFSFLLVVDGLERIPKRGNVIQHCEDIVRSTINTIFSTLSLRGIKDKPRLKEYSTLHKYFVSQTLQDDETLKYIQKLTKLDVGYKTEYYNSSDFIAAINEIIKEDKTHSIVDDVSVAKYIEVFIAELKKLRDTYASNTVYVNINTKVLESLRNIKPHNGSFKEDDDKYDDVIASDSEVWEPSGRRIYKGERTKIKYFPFMASIHIFNTFHCAGSIIKSDLVITASSCLQLAYNNRLFRENPAFLSVRVGSSFYSGGGEVVPVLEIYFHPGYDPKTIRNNLAIVRLTRHIKFSKNNKRVKRIDFDRSPWALPLTTPGITILGWGAKGKSGIVFNPFKNILSFAILDIYPRPDCEDIYSKEFVTHQHFCAGFISKGGGACNRDVGGPGVVDGKLLGVVSFGSPSCGTPDAPTVFTKLGFYTDWIEDVMEKKVPTAMTATTPKSDFDMIKAMLETTRSFKTTFKIAPITGKTMKPLSILDIEKALRLLDDDLFKQFVSTMFSSKEIDSYKNSLQNVTQETATEMQISTTELPSYELNEVPKVGTRMPDYDNEITTVAEEADNSESEVNEESDIVQFLKNVDLKKIIEEEVNVTENVKLETDKKDKNESVVTFLYISDEEKNGNIEDAVDEGLSIQAEEKDFEDMTRSKFKGYPQRDNLYGVLSEVIEKEVRNKLMNDEYLVVLLTIFKWLGQCKTRRYNFVWYQGVFVFL